MSITIVHRKPATEEFNAVITSVGFRSHEQTAVEIALANTLFCVCAEEEGHLIGVGRIVGDGAISLLLTNVMVLPTHQRRGIGSRIVKALCSDVEQLPYKNIVLEAVPQPGSLGFYERLGFRASVNGPPGVVRWFNDDHAANV